MRTARVVALAFLSSELLAACAGAPAVTAPTTSDSPGGASSSSVELSPPVMGTAASVDAASSRPIVDESSSAGNSDAGQATSTADAAVAASSTTGASSPAAPTSQAPPIPCKSTDDCWIKGGTTAAKPIRRPANLRGKKFRPCVDGEAAPICRAGVCATLGFGC